MIYDAAVIGAGPGGYECALGVRRLGGSVVLIEKGDIGGVCTNAGCIPTKALAASCEVYGLIKKSGEFGIDTGEIALDMKKIISRRDRISATMRRGVEKLLNDAGVEVVTGEARFKSEKEVEVDGKTFEAKNIVVASGSLPSGVGSIVLDGEYVISGDDAAKAGYIPNEVVIIGGGFIGCEWASIYSKLGSKVTLVEAMDYILPGEDKDISEEIRRILSRDIDILTSTKVESIDSKGRKVRCGDADIPADMVLLAVGRKPNIPEGLLNIGVEASDDGIIVSDSMMTTVEGIYAIGDVARGYKLAHTAYAGAEVAAKNIMGITSKADFSAVPWCIFTHPEIGRVGITENEAKDPLVGRAEYLSNGKARCMGERGGFCKVIAERETRRILGVHIIGAHASDLSGAAALAIRNKLSLTDVSETIHPHPTLAEILKAACDDAMRQV
jgi:dihydrolipoamide dehydrogenase